MGYLTGMIRKRPPVYLIERVGVIGDAFVLPQPRKSGVFTQLLDEIFAWMKERGVDYVMHPVMAKNDLGRLVWKKKGFEDSEVLTRRLL